MELSGNIWNYLVVLGNQEAICFVIILSVVEGQFMLVPPKYQLTPKISKLLASIEASRQIIDAITIPPEIESNIKRQSTLKSSLFSARIEGNQLSIDELESPSKTQQKNEVFNILKALQYMESRAGKDTSITELCQYHSYCMKGMFDTKNLGKFRAEVNAIFNKAGIAIYLPPPPQQVPPLVTRLLKFANSTKEPFIPVKAALIHFTFEKIHPFLDGNGRVGRLLLQKTLYHGGYGMKGLVSLEEFLDKHRDEYYYMLETPERDVTEYVEFMLNAMDTMALQAKELVLKKQKAEVADYLLPRRGEIYNLIKEQQLMSFDQIHRRFFGVNERTLRYDLKKLQDAGLIQKLGTTKGAYYQVRKK